MRKEKLICVSWLALGFLLSSNLSVAQDNLNLRVDQLLDRINELEGRGGAVSESIEDVRDLEQHKSTSYKEDSTVPQFSTEEKIDELLLRLEQLEGRGPTTEPSPESTKGEQPVMTIESPLPVLGDSDAVGKQSQNELSEGQIRDVPPDHGNKLRTSLQLESAEPQVLNTFDSEDMDLRIDELLERLNVLEKEGEKPLTLQSNETDSVGDDSPSDSIPTPPPIEHIESEESERVPLFPKSFSADLPPSKLAKKGPAFRPIDNEQKSEKDVGGRVDELLQRLDGLESSWNLEMEDIREDGLDPARNLKRGSLEEPTPLPIKELAIDEIEPSSELPPVISPDENVSSQAVGLNQLSEGMPGEENAEINMPHPSSFDVGDRVDTLLHRLKKLESMKKSEAGHKYQATKSNKQFKDHALPKRQNGFDSSPRKEPVLKQTPAVLSRAKERKSSEFRKMAESLKAKPKSQEGWNLLVLRELTLQHSPELLIKKAQVSTSKKSKPALEFGRYPTVKGKVSYNDYTKIASFQTWDSEPYGIFSYGLEGSWVLYDGHKTRKQIKTAELETKEAEWSLVVEEQKVLRQLIDHFFNALNAQVEVYFLGGIDRLIRERLRVYEKQVASGIQDRMLLNKTMRELENLRSQRLTAEHSVEASKSEISFLINADDDFWNNPSRFLSPPEFFMDYQFDPDSSAQAALGKSGVKVAESKYDEIKSGLSPVVELTSKAGYQGKNNIGIDSQGQEFSFGVSLTLPITDYYLTKSKLLKAREEIKQAEAKEYNLLRQQQNQYQSELLKLELAEKNFLLQKELYSLQKDRLEDMNFVSGRGLFDKSSALLEEEELLRRELSREHARIKTIKHKYLLDLIE